MEQLLVTPELIAILAVGVALAGLLWQGLRGLGTRIDRVEGALGTRIDQVEGALGTRIDRVEDALGTRIGRVEDALGARIDRVENALGARIGRVEEELREIRDRLSRLEGKVDFLEEYIVRRNEAGAPAE